MKEREGDRKGDHEIAGIRGLFLELNDDACLWDYSLRWKADLFADRLFSPFQLCRVALEREKEARSRLIRD